MSINALNALLDKTADWDKDERYMATNDLCNELAKDVKIDETMEKRICAAVLKQLDDQSNDVQSVAVKCLAILLKKIQEAQVGEICDKLCSLVVDGKAALRDIYSIGLKTLIADVPDAMGILVSERLTLKLLNGISKGSSDEIKRECLDNMSDLLGRFGHLISKDHEAIMKTVALHLEHEKPIMCKRAASCLGSLAVVSSDLLLNRLVEIILEKVAHAEKNKGSTSVEARTLIQTIGTISRIVGHRLSRHLERLVPLFLRFCGDADDENLQNDAANELRESCFPGLESFVVKCSRDVTPYINDILKVSLSFMKYDPNYSYDDNDADDMDVEDDEVYDDEDYEGSDDDDSSWKVRKVAVKVVNAIITSRPEMMEYLFNTCANELLLRFKEREENVRIDVILCFNSLLNLILMLNATSKNKDITNATVDVSYSLSYHLSSQKTFAINVIKEKLYSIMKNCIKQLQSNAIKTKSAVFFMLRVLVSILKEADIDNSDLNKDMQLVLPSLEKCILDSNQALKLDALAFLRVLLELNNVIDDKIVLKLLPHIIAAVNETWYKIIAEAIRVLGAIIVILRKPVNIPTTVFTNTIGNNLFSPYNEKLMSTVVPIYECLLPRLEAVDIDQEIKECTIITIGKLLAYLGDYLVLLIPNIMIRLRKRLENDTTRIPALRALQSIALSPLKLQLSAYLNDFVTDIALFLRQQSRLLRQTALITLEALIKSLQYQDDKNSNISNENLAIIFSEVSNLLSDNDLYLSTLAMKVLQVSICTFPLPRTGPYIIDNIYPKLLKISASPLLQGQTQIGLILLFQDIVSVIESDSTFTLKCGDIVSSLYNLSRYNGSNVGANTDYGKQSLYNLAKCIAAVCLKSSKLSERELLIEKFISNLTDSNSTDPKIQQFSLICIGEIGHLTDITNVGPTTASKIQPSIMSCLDSNVEDVKIAAAYALGHIAYGNMNAFLPIILKEIKSKGNSQYLILLSLKELIVNFANKNDLSFENYINNIMPCLIEQCKADEEGIRNMVAECLGTLTAMHATKLLPILKELASVDSNLQQSTITSAMRFTLSRQAAASSVTALTNEMPFFLTYLKSEDIEVRKNALLMVTASVHHNCSIIIPYLVPLVHQHLLDALTFKAEKIVDLGPFKHKVDDGLPIRKISLTCIDTVLDVCPETLDIAVLMSKLLLLFSDKDELRLQANQVLIKLCSISPNIILPFIDQLIDHFEKSVFKKRKEGITGPELERSNELIRSTLRSIIAMSECNVSDSLLQNRKWYDLIEKIKKDASLVEFMNVLQKRKDE